MIRLTVTSLIFLYILCSVIVLLLLWVVSIYRQKRSIVDKRLDFIWKCSVCCNDYIDSGNNDMSVCPLCGSYNKRDDKGVLR